jgi:hypothetical protein
MSVFRVERAVEVDGRADEGEVCERLWEVSNLVARRADLFGI